MDPMQVYPGAAHAIDLCERLQEKTWDMFRRTADIEGVPSLKEHMRGSVQRNLEACTEEVHELKRQVFLEALAEWDHPDFLKYLAAKVGAV